LYVRQNGAAILNYATEVQCQLSQDNLAKAAVLASRDPVTVLFRLDPGKIRCTLMNGTPINLCDMGSVAANGTAQLIAICDPEPVFQVAAFIGSLWVTDPNGEKHLVTQGTQLTCVFSTPQCTPAPAEFSEQDQVVFAAQASAMGLASPTGGLAPQAITFTSTPPPNPATGDRYIVGAAGGGSGNPVTFTIDAKSSKGVCLIEEPTQSSGAPSTPGNWTATVIFRGAGTCIIDAKQAGNARYQAAPQEHQDVTVTAPG
jgi:hypothetical protein